MYNDAAIRQTILQATGIEPWRIEMEDIDYGERIGMFYRSPEGVVRHAVPMKGRTENEVAGDFIAFISGAQVVTLDGVTISSPEMREPKSLWAQPKEFAEAVEKMLGDSPYEGKAGRHPLDCTCTRHAPKAG